ncbi:hypothetical protein [Dyella sp.]|jgi:hypothetical protein|uniref:hypothetical protein n=1 Tax=Dyella sp. TaxID=1869338 RepID=UPI002D798FC9|nr:hypothetical protein [Dyella sp.]HET6432003.1 hypothetical protein [Dyella sp.]
MRRSARQRLALLLGTVVLGSLALWQWQRDAAAAPGTLLDKTPEAIDHIALSLPGHGTEHYTKRDGHWWRVDGPPVPADDGRLGELAGYAAAPVASWRLLADFKPAQIGLSPPMAILQLDQQTLRFGDTSVTGPLRYVQVGQRVALVSARYTPRPSRAEAVQAD